MHRDLRKRNYLKSNVTVRSLVRAPERLVRLRLVRVLRDSDARIRSRVRGVRFHPQLAPSLLALAPVRARAPAARHVFVFGARRARAARLRRRTALQLGSQVRRRGGVPLPADGVLFELFAALAPGKSSE